jgi:hypothetical protein
VVVFSWWLWRHTNRDLDAEHPKSVTTDRETGRLEDLALRVAAEVPDDGEAVAAVRAAGGRRKDLRIAAASLRMMSYTWEHRSYLRAARLLKAAADGGPPLPPSAEQEALFRAVEHLEALPSDAAFATLASELPELRALEQRVATWLAEPTYPDVDDRLDEILRALAPIVGPRASTGSALARSETAYDVARPYLLEKAGIPLDDDDEDVIVVSERTIPW